MLGGNALRGRGVRAWWGQEFRPVVGEGAGQVGEAVPRADSAVAIASTSVVASPAQAVPPAGPNESIVFDYFSDAAKTIQVGGWIYGNCLPDFKWGSRTSFFNGKRVTCNPL